MANGPKVPRSAHPVKQVRGEEGIEREERRGGRRREEEGEGGEEGGGGGRRRERFGNCPTITWDMANRQKRTEVRSSRDWEGREEIGSEEKREEKGEGGKQRGEGGGKRE
eukprot:Phypoly_transcript_15264.p1 GENE.Phypoly_transcript_15264~~Phypoly_transcript_15264.p1  ORF type:complete len:110 (-),score=34.42 Phypoly_transcript_15264:87-416(-)